MLYTKLSIVNEMLGLLGEAPVSSLDSFHPMVPGGINVLETTSGEIQSDRWWFNTERRTLQPQVDTKYILLPAETTSVDTIKKLPRVAQRGLRLYNLDDNTYEFDQAIKVELRLYFPFDELPNIARAYIGTEALVRFQNSIDGADEKTRMLIGHRLKDTEARFHAEHTRQVQANMLRRNGPLRLALGSKYNRSAYTSRVR